MPGPVKWPRLHKAALSGNLAAMRRLLDEGTDVDMREPNSGFTAAYLAAGEGNLRSLELLMSYDARLDLSSFTGSMLPLHIAAYNGKLDVVNLLLSTDSPRALRSSRGESALHLAAAHGHDAVCRALLEAGADVHGRTSRGASALHAAAAGGYVEAMNVLYEHGAALGARDNDGLTPLRAAESAGKAQAVHLLTDWSAAERRERQRYRDRFINALHAARGGDLRHFSEFLAAGGDVNFAAGRGKQTALHAVAQAGPCDAVSWLLERGADPNACDRRGRTPLHAAVFGGSRDVCTALLAAGADLYAADAEGVTPLEQSHLAATESSQHAISTEWLLQAADTAAREASGAGSGAAEGGSGSCGPPLVPVAQNPTDPSPTPPAVPPPLHAEVGEERERLRRWLAHLHLERFHAALVASSFDTLHIVRSAREEDLAEIGLRVGHRRTLLRAVAELDRDWHDPAVVAAAAAHGIALQPAPGKPPGAGAPDPAAPPGTPGSGGSSRTGDEGASECGSPMPAATTPSQSDVPLSLQGRVIGAEELRYARGNGRIGEGCFGIVFRASWRGMDVAVKQLREDVELRTEELAEPKTGPKTEPKTEPGAGAAVDAPALAPPPAPPQAASLSRASSSETRRDRLTAVDSARREMLKECVQRGLCGGERREQRGALSRAHAHPYPSLSLSLCRASVMERVCHHDNVVQFVGVLLEPKRSVVTRFMPRGSVQDVLVQRGARQFARDRLRWADLVRMAADAAAGILHLHREGVIHRDLACRNLLVDEHLRVRVADFGFARFKEASHSKGLTRSSVGPVQWMAPEALQLSQYSGATCPAPTLRPYVPVEGTGMCGKATALTLLSLPPPFAQRRRTCIPLAAASTRWWRATPRGRACPSSQWASRCAEASGARCRSTCPRRSPRSCTGAGTRGSRRASAWRTA